MTTRGRPPLSLGTYGEISVKEIGTRNGKTIRIASARFRDSDGKTKKVTKTHVGGGEAAAKDALKKELTARIRRLDSARLDSAATIRQLHSMWQEEASPSWSIATRERYRYVGDYILTEIGDVRVGELSRSVINGALRNIRGRHGWSSAKSAKSVLSGMCKLALLFDMLEVNPVSDTITVSRPERKGGARALTADERADLVARLHADDQAHELDLVDLVDFMLGTGCRIGEACAARPRTFVAESWEICATIVRAKGHGLMIQERPKTAAGWRRIALPGQVGAMLARRTRDLSLSAGAPVVFASPYTPRALRDPKNTAADLRRVLDRIDYPWVTSHTFRRTVATRLLDAGMAPQQVADHLGHTRPSMTLDHYAGRQVVSSEAARVLEI